jgi:acetyl esterase/lipase
MIGQGQGRAALDAVRAAKQLDDVSRADQTVVWGHSQGGHAALWAGQLASSYAPDVDVVGVAALAPASDLIDNFETVTGASIFTSFMMRAYTRIYSDVDFDDYVRPTARIQLREMASRCLSEPGTLVSVVSSLPFDKSVLNNDPATGPLGTRLKEDTPQPVRSTFPSWSRRVRRTTSSCPRCRPGTSSSVATATATSITALPGPGPRRTGR